MYLSRAALIMKNSTNLNLEKAAFDNMKQKENVPVRRQLFKKEHSNTVRMHSTPKKCRAVSGEISDSCV